MTTNPNWPPPATGGLFAGVQKAENIANAIQDKLDPLAPQNIGEGQVPRFGTGARSLIKIGGKPIAVCQSMRWQVQYIGLPIQTIDTPFPWDIDIGQATITAALDRVIDPRSSAEADALFSIMQAAVHQPLVEMQVLDAFGSSIFFARGMFTSISGNMALGQLGGYSAQFIGVAYQHWVAQQFKPYDGIAGGLSNLIGGLANLASNLSGGLI
jgi:hypothetical protein